MTDRKANIKILDGNQAAAQGAKLSRVQVIAAYPITPQTPVTEALSEFVERGDLSAEYVAVESEHSALTVCASASIIGARTFTARDGTNFIDKSISPSPCFHQTSS